MAPNRPPPTGSASSHLAAGCEYHSTRSLARPAAIDVNTKLTRAPRTVESLISQPPSSRQRKPDAHLRFATVVPRIVRNQGQVNLACVGSGQLAIKRARPIAG